MKLALVLGKHKNEGINIILPPGPTLPLICWITSFIQSVIQIFQRYLFSSYFVQVTICGDREIFINCYLKVNYCSFETRIFQTVACHISAWMPDSGCNFSSTPTFLSEWLHGCVYAQECLRLDSFLCVPSSIKISLTL